LENIIEYSNLPTLIVYERFSARNEQIFEPDLDIHEINDLKKMVRNLSQLYD